MLANEFVLLAIEFVTLAFEFLALAQKFVKIVYVWPILEYAVCAWAPHAQCYIDKLESVQRRAARFATGDFHLTSSVTQMLTTLNWDSLNYRIMFRLQMMYKIIHSIVDLSLPDYIRRVQQKDYQRT